MLNKLFTTGLTEPKSQSRRKRLVRLLARLRKQGFKVQFRAGKFFA